MTPGEGELALSELSRTREALAEVTLLLDAGSLEGAASRLDYAAFHAARAALTGRGQHSRTHAGQINLFRQSFGAVPILDRLLDERAKADYGLDAYATSAGELRELRDQAAAFVVRCAAIVDDFVRRGADEPDHPPTTDGGARSRRCRRDAYC